MKERFDGFSGHRRLLSALQSQKVVEGDAALAEALANVAKVEELEGGDELIQEGGSENATYFVLAGKVSIHVKGQLVAERSIGDHVGEMAAIDPSQPRSATVTARKRTVVAKVAEPALVEIADAHPAIWRNMAKELSRRLVQRNRFFQQSNDEPHIFVACSSEALPIAREVQSALSQEAIVKVWTDGVFFASGYTLEALEQELEASDFAVAIAQPDDVVQSRGKSKHAPRDNVIFELGFFMGRLGRRRTFLMQPSGRELKTPSDLHGLTAISYRTGAVNDMAALIAPACNKIRKHVQELGVLI